MNSSKNGIWIIPFKKFSRIRVNCCYYLIDPDFRKQSQLLQCIEDAEVDQVNFTSLLVPSTSELFEKECLVIIEQLINKQKFDEARKLAKIAAICCDHITIQQVCNKIVKFNFLTQNFFEDLKYNLV